MRDTIKNKTYFNKFIREEYSIIEKFEGKMR